MKRRKTPVRVHVWDKDLPDDIRDVVNKYEGQTPSRAVGGKIYKTAMMTLTDPKQCEIYILCDFVKPRLKVKDVAARLGITVTEVVQIRNDAAQKTFDALYGTKTPDTVYRHLKQLDLKQVRKSAVRQRGGKKARDEWIQKLPADIKALTDRYLEYVTKRGVAHQVLKTLLQTLDDPRQCEIYILSDFMKRKVKVQAIAEKFEITPEEVVQIRNDAAQKTRDALYGDKQPETVLRYFKPMVLSVRGGKRAAHPKKVVDVKESLRGVYNQYSGVVPSRGLLCGLFRHATETLDDPREFEVFTRMVAVKDKESAAKVAESMGMPEQEVIAIHDRLLARFAKELPYNAKKFRGVFGTYAEKVEAAEKPLSRRQDNARRPKLRSKMSVGLSFEQAMSLHDGLPLQVDFTLKEKAFLARKITFTPAKNFYNGDLRKMKRVLQAQLTQDEALKVHNGETVRVTFTRTALGEIKTDVSFPGEGQHPRDAGAGYDAGQDNQSVSPAAE